MAYSEAQQALAVEIVTRYGGQVTYECLAEVRRILGNPMLNKVTVYRWLQNKATQQKNVTPEARQQAARALDQIFEDVARVYAEHALTVDVIDKANATQSMIAAGTAVDKMRLLRGLPTEIVKVLPELVDEAERSGIQLGPILENLTTKIRQARSNGDIIH